MALAWLPTGEWKLRPDLQKNLPMWDVRAAVEGREPRDRQGKPLPPPLPSAETKEEATVEENAGDAPTPVWERLLSARFFWGLRRAANRE